MTEKLESRKVIIMSSVLSQKGLGACLSKFKERLGLRGQEDLVILVKRLYVAFHLPFQTSSTSLQMPSAKWPRRKLRYDST